MMRDWGRTWLWLSAFLLLTYAGYVIIAKFGKLIGLALPFQLGDVGEFWLFASFIGTFCMQIIRDERRLPPAHEVDAPPPPREAAP
jgi:hypothetical protein